MSKPHYLKVAGFTAKFGDSPGPSLSLPDQIKENCQEEGYDMVSVDVQFQNKHFFVSKLKVIVISIYEYMIYINLTIMASYVVFIVNLADDYILNLMTRAQYATVLITRFS